MEIKETKVNKIIKELTAKRWDKEDASDFWHMNYAECPLEDMANIRNKTINDCIALLRQLDGARKSWTELVQVPYAQKVSNGTTYSGMKTIGSIEHSSKDTPDQIKKNLEYKESLLLKHT